MDENIIIDNYNFQENLYRNNGKDFNEKTAQELYLNIEKEIVLAPNLPFRKITTLHLISPPLTEFRIVPINSHLIPLGQTIPPQFANIYERHLKALQAKLANGDIFDGPVVVLRGWHIASDNLFVEIQHSSYVVMSAVRKTYVEALNIGLLTELDIPLIPHQIGACLCACVIVLTADNQIISLRRPEGFPDAGTVALGLGEVLEPSDFNSESLSLHRAGARALREELGVTLTPEQTAQFVKPMYLARAQEGGAWVFVIIVDLRHANEDFNAECIIAQADTAEDAYESELRQAVPFNRLNLDRFLQENAGRLGLWAEELVEILMHDF